MSAPFYVRASSSILLHYFCTILKCIECGIYRTYVSGRKLWDESVFHSGGRLVVHMEGWGIWSVRRGGTYCPIVYLKLRGLITLFG